MTGKKAQGMPINTIIIAIIALVVLVVLIAIFTGRTAIFGKGTAACPGTCNYDSCPEGTVLYAGNFTTDKTGASCAGKICCIEIVAK